MSLTLFSTLPLFPTFSQRLDSFAELVSSSIEYGESTSHQLQPSKNASLNVPLHKRILELTENVRNLQGYQAFSGGAMKPPSQGLHP